jgi:hypothetical protein
MLKSIPTTCSTGTTTRKTTTKISQEPSKSASTNSGGEYAAANITGKTCVWADCAHFEHACFFMYLYSEHLPPAMRNVLHRVNSEIGKLVVQKQYHVLNWLLADRKKERMLQDYDELVNEQPQAGGAQMFALMPDANGGVVEVGPVGDDGVAFIE